MWICRERERQTDRQTDRETGTETERERVISAKILLRIVFISKCAIKETHISLSVFNLIEN